MDKESYSQPGLDIQCVSVGAGQVDNSNEDSPTVPAQNSCLLSCDYYPVLTFYTKGDAWVYKYMDEADENPLEADDVKDTIVCW